MFQGASLLKQMVFSSSSTSRSFLSLTCARTVAANPKWSNRSWESFPPPPYQRHGTSTLEKTPVDRELPRCQFLHLARHHTNLSCFQNAIVGYWVRGDNKLVILIVQYGVHGLPRWGIRDISVSHFEYCDFNISFVLRHLPMVLQSKGENGLLMTS